MLEVLEQELEAAQLARGRRGGEIAPDRIGAMVVFSAGEVQLDPDQIRSLQCLGQCAGSSTGRRRENAPRRLGVAESELPPTMPRLTETGEARPARRTG